ncbi:MAG: hypothetical protein JWQ73_218 [Variovorax sp.]|nr:hypothetical protein [Variovorax sp.]
MSPTRLPTIVIVVYVTLFSAFLAFSAATEGDTAGGAKANAGPAAMMTVAAFSDDVSPACRSNTAPH